jgi:predicted GNAT family acetyltransferase
MGDETQVTVTEDPEREAYLVEVDGEPAGLLAYRRVPDRTVFLHTEVDDRFGGRGIGSQLIRAALDGERAQGHQVEPRCPFVAAFIRRHPEDADLVPDRYRSLLDE